MRKKKYSRERFYRRLEAQNANKVFPIREFQNCFERFAKAANLAANKLTDLSRKLAESLRNMPEKQRVDVCFGGQYIGSATSVHIEIS